MRRVVKADGFSVQAISGTRAVILAMNAKRETLDNFLGFGIGVKKADGTIKWLDGFKCFRSINSSPEKAQRFKTNKHPIQGWSWGHY